MIRSALVYMFGFPAMLIHGDTGVLDRYIWLSQRLPMTNGAEKLIDIGCGSGAFTIAMALRGYDCLGLDYDASNIRKAIERINICKATNASVESFDVGILDRRHDLQGRFDVAVSLEVIEHVFEDIKLMRDIAACLKPGGRLLLTTPNFHYRPIMGRDNGPWPSDRGGHVRKGYTEEDLVELCCQAGLICDSISYCTGFLSQKVTWIWRMLRKIYPLLAWAMILPLRVVPPLFDCQVTTVLRWPYFSICLDAHKPTL